MTRSEVCDRDFAAHYDELYPVALEHFSGMPHAESLAKKEAARLAFRIMCRTDLWFLATEVFRMHEGKRARRKIWYDEFQGAMVDGLASDEDSLLWFTRNMLKSTVVEIYVVQLILDDPANVVIMLGSESSPLGRRKLVNIKRRLKHPKLLMAFPDRIPANERKWEKSDQDMLTLTRDVVDEEMGTREIPPSEPQIRVFGAETAVTGDHPTHILFDDFITEKNTTSATQIQKAVTKFEAVSGLSSIETIMKIVGTPWHSMDLYHHIIENKIFDTLIRIPGVHMEGDKEVIDYKWFTHEFLAKQKKRMRHLYWPQYHLDTRPREDQMFKPPYPIWEELPEDVEYYIGVDPSTGKTEEHDKSGIVVGAVEVGNPSSLYLVEAEAYPLLPEKLADLVLNLILRYHPVRIGIELGLQAAVLPLIRLKAQEMAKNVAVEMPEFLEISTGGGTAGAKWQKIEGTYGAMLRDGRVKLREGMGSLRLQMELFDKNKQKNDDDILDAARDCILAVPYFSYGRFTVENKPEAKKLTWKDLMEAEGSEKDDRARMFAN